MGYPWINQATGDLELTVVDDVGQTTAETGARALFANKKVRVIRAQASIAQLDKLADDVTRLGAKDAPDYDLIWKTEPNQRDNLVVITISKGSPELAAALADRFGTSLIAVRVQENPQASTGSRDSDAPAFKGGAKISTPGFLCTAGFAWTTGSVNAMLTAAHCVPGGGEVSYPNYSHAGTVNDDAEENWNSGVGTVYYTGQSVYRGDVALIRYSYATAPYIFSGAAGAGTFTGVADMFSRRSQFGDSACDNGYVHGLWCGVVAATGLNVKYFLSEGQPWVRNVVEDDAPGWDCPGHGDSGSPIYFIKDDGNVRAKGIFSGFAFLGVACSVWYTDIWDSWTALPGVLKHL
jgi:hypothetical protein